MSKKDPQDPTLVRNQPSLTTSTGREWLIIGAIMLVICVIVLWLLRGRPPTGLAIGTIWAVVALYLAMIGTRVLITSRRIKLAILAVLLAVMALLTLASVLVIAGSQLS